MSGFIGSFHGPRVCQVMPCGALAARLPGPASTHASSRPRRVHKITRRIWGVGNCLRPKPVHLRHSDANGRGRSGTLDGYYWVRDVQSGPPLGPSRSKGSEAGCWLSSGSSMRSKCPPRRFVPGGRAAERRRSVPNGDSRRVDVAESSRSTRARRGSVDVSVVMFGDLRGSNGGRSRQDVRSERVVA